jgi:hypothetical protein
MADSRTAPGSLASIELVEVDDAELDAARAGREHGAYDETVGQFLQTNARGMKVAFEGVKANSVKTSLGNAITRAVEKGATEKGTLEVRMKGDNVYLVRTAASA